MKPNVLPKRAAAVTTHDEENVRVRARAYQLYNGRGRIEGHAEEDWLQAEGEVAQSKKSKPVLASSAKSL